MSTFDTFETSVESSRPIEIYKFSMGSQTFTYTSWADTVTVSSVDYEAEAIARSRLGLGSEQRNRNLIVSLPATNAFASKYVNVVPGEKAALTIIRLQPDETPSFNTQVLIFKGDVQSVRYPQDGHSAEVVCRSVESKKNQNLPRMTYMSACNHFLYDNGCGVDSSLFNIVGAATNGATAEITVAGANAEADGHWTGGYCTPTSGSADFRMIIKHVGNVLTLLLPFAADVTGLNVQVFAGCDHDLFGDCKTKFENADSYGGFAFVPTRNPFESGLESN